MSLLKKTIGFVAVLGTLPAAYALTARPSIIGTASSRMPTMTTTIYGTTSSTASAGTSSLLANAECIDAYTSCMKGADTCGSEFEECTTKVLFHGKMAQCLSTLAQCNSTGINSLFGVGNINSLQTVATKNSYGEVTDYTYPTDGSILGQMIIGAAISNKYDTSTCVKRYTSCLKKDSVCGDDFELCTTDKEFRKQRVYCDSTLARCQSDGVIELFGSNSLTVAPSATSRIGELIAEGAALAAVNAVSTCYKVVDQCILNACATNPYRCNEAVSKSVVELVENINNGVTATDGSTTVAVSDLVSKSEVSGYIKSSCLDTIGSNKYCYATFLGNGMMPTASQLKDEDNQEEIFDEAYSARMNSAMKSKIADLVDKFDTKAKQKCTETIRTCAMRTCGSGSGATCYYQVFGSKDKSINTAETRSEIKTGCEAVVNTDPYCKYAAANPNASGPYSYAYINTSAFDTLFPEYDSANPDPIGVVASLNASLANNYSDAALAQMKKQCQSVATSCVKSLCGADYVNCYRNRTDIYSSLTNTGDSSFDKSMNKVGGVLDYTIVLGLCLDTVKNASVCEEHLAIEASKVKINSNRTTSWGTNSVRGDWIDAGAATAITANTETVQEYDANGQPLCSSKTGDQGVCYSVDESGNVYDQPVMVSVTTYKQTQAASTLFKDLIYDIEKEAQAKYNAKLTKEQNACLAMNQGGLLGKSDTGSAYMWVKLRSNKVPKNYSINGLDDKQIIASNDLYGSFCRARITLQSDDKNIQELIRKGPSWATAYFAVGDVYTCGSWIPNSVLENIANELADNAAHKNDAQYNRVRDWMTALGAVGGTVGGGYLGAGIQNGSVFGGLTGISNNKTKTDVDNKKRCTLYIDYAIEAAGRLSPSAVKDTGSYAYVKDYTDKALKACENLEDVKDSLPYKDVKDAKNALGLAPFTGNSTNTWADGQEDKVKSLITALQKLRDAAENSDGESASNGKNKQWIGSTIGSVVGGVGGAFLLRQITTDVQDSKRDAAKQAAYDEFMNTIGNHIQCYIGGEEAGTYGQTYQIYME